MGPTNQDVSVEVSSALLLALRDPAFYPHPVDRVEVIETRRAFVGISRWRIRVQTEEAGEIRIS